MKQFKEFLGEGVSQNAYKIVEHINKQFNNMFGINTAMFGTRVSSRMWTRGDGSRYKEPSSIQAEEMPYIFKKYPETKEKFGTRSALIDFAWKQITSMPKAKSIGKVKGEFTSSGYEEAYQVGTMIFIKGTDSIRFATKSILKNVDVWEKK